MTSTFTIPSRQDGLKLHVLTVAPDKPRAVLQISHGMCEYKERYLSFMEYMAGQGIACIIHDHRGHGKSVKSRKDLGYFYGNGGPALVKDLHQVTCLARKLYPGLPLFLFGHSMGSLAVRVYLKYYERELDGLVVCGSPSHNVLAGPAGHLVAMMSAIHGDHSHSALLDRMMSILDLPFWKEHIPHAWICTDRAVVERFNASPYCNFTFTRNGYQALFWLMEHTYQKQGWYPKRPALPVLFLSGEKDPCMVSRKQFQHAVRSLRTAGYCNIRSLVYPGMRHEVLNEPGHMSVYQDIAKFIIHHL